LAEPVEVIRAASLAPVPHGFLGRKGGVSTGLVAGLDMGLRGLDPSDPALEAVRENRRRGVAAVLPGARLCGVYQVHGADCVEAGDWDEAERPRADALVTNRPGILLGILTADCAPVLFADRSAGVIGAAHAGWALRTSGNSTLKAMSPPGWKVLESARLSGSRLIPTAMRSGSFPSAAPPIAVKRTMAGKCR